MKNTCPDSRYQIKNQKSFLAPVIFKNRRCGSHNQHIEKYMKEVGMSKHVGEKLIRPEFVCFRIPQGEQGGETWEKGLRNENYNIDNDDISNNRRKS